MALDTATTHFLTEMAAQGGPPLHEMTPQEARGLGPALTEMTGPGPEVASVEDLTLDPTDGGDPFRVRVLTPPGEVAGVLVYLHGGGWVIGDIDQFDTLGRQLATRTGCAVVLVEYRKAPEVRYPAAVEDSWQALLWAAEHTERIAGRSVPLVLGGDSAGGNLTAVLTRRAREAGGPAISLQVLVYPVADADLQTPSYVAPENQLMLSRETMIWFWDLYADPDRRGDADASPLRAADLAGLPPAVVLIAEHDVLRSEGEAYAEALRAAGVDVDERLFEGQMHGFFTMVNILPGSAAGVDHVVDRVNAHLAHVPARSTTNA